MMRELRELILRGNVVDLAVGLVIGVAFTAVVTAFTDGILLALIAAVIGRPDFDELAVLLNDTPIESDEQQSRVCLWARACDLRAVDEVERAITEALRCTGMRETQRRMIRVHLDAPPDPTTCCGSSCDPCVITLARAVHVARRALGRDD